MNRLDREILKAVLIDQKSKYGLEAYLKKNGIKSNYATVWRYINRMKKDGLLTIIKPSRKNGKLDKRRTEKPVLTPKGMATLIIEGDLQKEEIRIAVLKFLQKKLSDMPNKFWKIIPIEDVFADVLLKLKPKVNLKYFDENYFTEIFVTELFNSFTAEPIIESVLENSKKINLTKEEALQINDMCNKIAKKEGFPKQPLEGSFKYGKQLGSKFKRKEQS